jgi:hypothetical protein
LFIVVVVISGDASGIVSVVVLLLVARGLGLNLLSVKVSRIIKNDRSLYRNKMCC